MPCYTSFWRQAFRQTPTVFGVRTESHKYCWYHGIFDLNEPYDLKEDPHEMHNLIDHPRYFQVRREMEQKLPDLVEKYGATRVPKFKS